MDELFKLYSSPQLENLIKVLRGIKETDYLFKIGEIKKKVGLNYFDSGGGLKEVNYFFVETAKEGFKKPLLKKVLAGYDDFKYLYKFIKSVLLFQGTENNDKLTDNVIETCQNFTYNIEDFNNNSIMDDYVDFFKSFQNITYDNEITVKFAKLLEDVLYDIKYDLNFEFELLSIIKSTANYLDVCNTIKNNKLTVSIDDVINAYITIFKFIINDIDEIIKDVKEEKIVKVEPSKSSKKNKIKVICVLLGFSLIIAICIGAIMSYNDINYYGDEKISFDYYNFYYLENISDYYLSLHNSKIRSSYNHHSDIGINIDESPSDNLDVKYNYFKENLERDEFGKDKFKVI